MEGPRGLLAWELGSLRELTDIVMRPGLVDQFPHLFDEENLENLRVCLYAGRCVSHVGMIQRDASLFGCRVRVGCIGAVSTHPDYRRRGLASACFDDALRKAGQDGDAPDAPTSPGEDEDTGTSSTSSGSKRTTRKAGAS